MTDVFEHPRDPSDPAHVNPAVREKVVIDNRSATTSHFVGLSLAAVAMTIIAAVWYYFSVVAPLTLPSFF